MARFHRFDGIKHICASCERERVGDTLYRTHVTPAHLDGSEFMCRECAAKFGYITASEWALYDAIVSANGQIERFLLGVEEVAAAKAMITRGILNRGTFEGDARMAVYCLER